MTPQRLRKYTLAQIATHIGADLKGDPDCMISAIAPLQQAQKGQISFLDNKSYRKYLADTKASAVILSENNITDCAANLLVMQNPYLGYAKTAELFEIKAKSKMEIHPSVVIGDNSSIAQEVSIGPYCVVGKNVVIEKGVVIGAGCVIDENTQIGAQSELKSHVTLYHGTKIGQRAIIHSGVVIGSDGFGFANDRGIWYKIPQIGNVRIGNDVEIGANTTIDRGALNDTQIDDGVKLDNQIQIGHNVHIGAHTIIAGCVAIAGSTTIGKYCMIGGAAVIAGHLKIADKVIITGMSGVASSIQEPGIYSAGSVIQKHKSWLKNSVRITQLDEMARRLHQLEKNSKC
jgi:UDP-3-O-[3-hydroxymyristoyl] glucosamine N-acyltransferase